MPKFKKLLKITGAVMAAVVLLAAAHRAPARTANQPQNMRGVWLTDVGTLGLIYTTLLDETLHHIGKSGYDRVYFSVYGLRGQLYDTQQRSERIPKLPFINPLAVMAREARRQGLKPYAWFEFGLMLPQNDPVVKKNPDWLLTLPNGKQAIENHGIPMVWLDPGHPEVEAYILGHIDDILKEKSLAGVQLDDHWAVPRPFGDHRRALTALTRKVHQRIKAKNPELALSLSPNPYRFSLHQYNQDWLAWVRRGIVDEVVVQVYRTTPTEVQQSVANSGIDTASRYVPVGVGLHTGLKVQPFNLQAIQAQIRAVENQNLGYSLFVWEYMLLRQAGLFRHLD